MKYRWTWNRPARNSFDPAQVEAIFRELEFRILDDAPDRRLTQSYGLAGPKKGQQLALFAAEPVSAEPAEPARPAMPVPPPVRVAKTVLVNSPAALDALVAGLATARDFV